LLAGLAAGTLYGGDYLLVGAGLGAAGGLAIALTLHARARRARGRR